VAPEGLAVVGRPRIFGEAPRVALGAALGAALALFAGCADLLGVVPLTGTDASTPDAGTTPEDVATPEAGPASEPDGCTISWVDASSGAVPPGAVPNPVPGSTVEIYVCRTFSQALGGVIPGKLLPGYFCYYGDGQQTEISAADYAVFVPQQCTLAWAPSPNGVDPVGAVQTGTLLDGGILYSCRVATTGPDPGELGHMGWSTDHQCVYSLSGQSLRATDFDVLTAQ
jgi:hypothetical protein